MKLPIIFNNRYQLNSKLGEGGLAEVYLAQDLALSRLVAVKLLRHEYTTDPTFLVRFHREAQNAASLNSSNVVSVYDFGQDHNRPYIVMEYVSGQDLRATLDREVLTIPQILEYAIQICNGVATAHRRGMVHGDLKPGNILISPTNRIKVTDFGLARALGESAMDDGELVWGTPAYFAPEQAAGDRVLPATDVYAIGIILYEMLTGGVPFQGGSDQEIARKQLYEAPAPIANRTNRVPAKLAEIVHKALVKDPHQRFHSADQLKQALIDFTQQMSGQTSFQPAQRSPAGSAFDWLTVMLGILALLAILGLVPLWAQVYRVYAAPSLPPGPPGASLPTLQPGQVQMPSLQGLSETQAQEIMDKIELKLEVRDYRPDPAIRAFAIVEQSVNAGMPLNRGTTVYVTLSQGQDRAEVPDVTGLVAREAERQLTQAGFLVQLREVWSPEADGLVAKQDPPPNGLLAEQSVIRLDVNGGTRVDVRANFDNQFILSAFELPRIIYLHTDTIPITLFWQVVEPDDHDYQILLALTTLEGQPLAQYRSQAATQARSGVGRLIGSDEVVDPYQLKLPDAIAAGSYQLRLALIDPQTETNLVIIAADELQENLNSLILQEIRVN